MREPRTEPPRTLLERVRKLLAKAESTGTTPAEAEALTAKAAELMARYGIDRAMLAATHPETDQPGNRIITVPAPWARVRAHLLSGLAGAMRCQAILLHGQGSGARVHLFGYQSDLERADLIYTSLLLQMANGLSLAPVPARASSPRAWRHSWLLGFVSAVLTRVKAAEDRAATAAAAVDTAGASTALVLADRSLVIRRQAEEAYPNTRATRISSSGTGYRDGYAKGQRADIGRTRLSRRRALPSL